MSLEQAYELLAGKLSTWLEAAIEMVPNVATALVVLVAFYFLARGSRTAVSRLLDKLGVHDAARRLMARVAQFIVIGAGLMIALSVLDLDGAVASLLAGAGIVGLALGFAFQDIAANFISGVGLSFRRPFERGDLIETNGVTGIADRISLRSTELLTPDGKRVIIPNREIFQNTLVNHSTEPARRVDVRCGVSYDDDLERVRELVGEAVDRVSARIDDRPTEVFFEGFGSSSIDFVVRFWIPFESQADHFAATSDAIRLIKRTFDAHGVTIPFPIRTLHLASTDGEALSEAPRPEPEGSKPGPIDRVHQAGVESFPASDPPSFTPERL